MLRVCGLSKRELQNRCGGKRLAENRLSVRLFLFLILFGFI